MPRPLGVALILLGLLAIGANVYLGSMLLGAGNRPLGQGVVVYCRHPEIEKAYVEGSLRSMSARFTLVDATPVAASGGIEEEVRDIEDYHALSGAAKFFPQGTVLLRAHPLAVEPIRVLRSANGIIAVVSGRDDPHELFPHGGSGLPEGRPELRRVTNPKLLGDPQLQPLDRQLRVAARLSLGFPFEEAGPEEEPEQEGGSSRR